MNVAVIFAGGTGQRMSSSGIPKQFLLVNHYCPYVGAFPICA